MGAALGVGLAHVVVCDVAGRVDGEAVAEECGVAELLHEGEAELVERVGEDDHLLHRRRVRDGQAPDGAGSSGRPQNEVYNYVVDGHVRRLGAQPFERDQFSVNCIGEPDI